MYFPLDSRHTTFLRRDPPVRSFVVCPSGPSKKKKRSPGSDSATSRPILRSANKFVTPAFNKDKASIKLDDEVDEE